MKLIKRVSAIGITLIIVSVVSWLITRYLPNTVWGIVEAIGTILGVLLVIVELRESRDLSEGAFITGLTDSFNNNESIQRIYKKLELGEIITDDDTIDIVTYLTYFETIYVLLKKKAIDLSLIDDLFSYRFRLAIDNPAIQRISLIRHDMSYVNLYRLEKVWCRYKKQESILLKVNPNNYPIVLRSSKMKKDEILLRVATEEDVKKIYDLMREVYERLEDKSLYVCDDLDFVKDHIANEGFAVVACTKEEKIVASFIFRYPMMHEDNLGKEINLPKEELPKVVHMESVVVLPEYRGNALQYKMLQYAEKLIDTDKFKYFMATVSPKNPASYKSIEKNGYTLIDTKEKYGGLIRRIYCKNV